MFFLPDLPRWILFAPVLCLGACSPPEGSRRPEIAYWDGGPPAIVRMEGEEVFWEGKWVNDGPVKYYGKTGQIEGTGTYVLGLEEGEWQLMESGIRATGAFHQGKRVGPWVYSYPSGKPQEMGSYLDGKREGEWRTFYSDGKLKTQSVYQDGVTVGPVKSWDVNGQPR